MNTIQSRYLALFSLSNVVQISLIIIILKKNDVPLLLNNRKWQSWEAYENDQMGYWEHTLCLKVLIKAIHVGAY